MILGISDYWALVAAVLVFADAIGSRVRAHERLARLLQRLAGVFPIGFAVRLAR